MDKAGKQRQAIIAILLAGAIMGMAFSGMYVSKSWSFEAFYDVGNVYEEFTALFFQGSGVAYNNESGQLEVQAEAANQYWILPANLADYNYFILELDRISQENPEVLFQFYSGENLVNEVPMQLQEGKNVLEITDKTATMLYMSLYQKQGLSYGVKAVEYREKLPVWNSRTFWAASLLFFFCCVAILFFARWVLRKKGIALSVTAAQESLQKIFAEIANKVNRKPFVPKAVHFWRKALFFFLISLMNYGERTAIPRKILSRNIKIYCIVMLVIAILSLEKQRKVRNWNHPLAISWFWMVACMVISYFIVPKRANLGMIYLVVFGFFFFVLGNMEKPEEMLYDLCAAIKWEFWLCMAYSCVFYPEQEGYVYQGVFRNPNILAIYVLAPCCVFLAELVNEKEEKVWVKCISALGFGISVCMIWKTQCRSVAGGLVLAVMVSIYILLRKKHSEKKGKGILRGFILMAVIIAGMFLGHAGINTFAGQSNLEEVSYGDNQKKQGDMFTLYAKAADLHNKFPSCSACRPAGRMAILTMEAKGFYSNKFLRSIITSRSLDEFASGRFIYWKAYLRQMNFWGHEFKAVINGKRWDAHNGILSIAYQYGVLSAVPYLFYLFYYVLYGCRHFRHHRGQRKYAAFPLLLILFVFPFLLLDNLESPFRYEAWFVVYLTTGVLFEEKIEWKKE